MTHVKFINNQPPCIVYRVHAGPEMQFDEVVFNKYVECWKIDALDWVPCCLLEACNPDGNNSAVDVMVNLSI